MILLHRVLQIAVFVREPQRLKGRRECGPHVLNRSTIAMDAMSDMPGAERRIVVSTERNGNSADLSVPDVGPGIPSAALKKVFEPFFTTKPQGMGMALSIARNIVEAHGGQLLAQNRAGRGAEFHVVLPLVLAAA